MSYEQLKQSALPRALSDVVADLADLLQKELRLARAEVSSKLSTKLRAGLWMSLAAGLGLITLLLLLQAAVFGIAAYGLPLHWSCLSVAVGVGIAAAICYAVGRGDANAELAPTRTIHQMKQDIATAKEQLT